MATILRLREVIRRTGRGRTAIYDGMDAGTFPRAVPLGPKSVGWLDHEIDEWIESRVAERDRKPRTARAAS